MYLKSSLCRMHAETITACYLCKNLAFLTAIFSSWPINCLLFYENSILIIKYQHSVIKLVMNGSKSK